MKLNFKQYLEAGSNIGGTGGGSHYDQGLIYTGSGSYMPPEEAARRQAHNAGIPFPTPLTPDVQQFYPEPTTIDLQKKRKLKFKKKKKVMKKFLEYHKEQEIKKFSQAHLIKNPSAPKSKGVIVF